MSTNKLANILIVDDEEDICRVLKGWFESSGYQVSYRTSSAEALELFNKEQFQLVLLDIRMPDESGLEVLKKIKAIDPVTVVILMTGFPSDDTVTSALSLGAYDYLVKPFQIEKVQFLLERAVSYYKLASLMRKPSK